MGEKFRYGSLLALIGGIAAYFYGMHEAKQKAHRFNATIGIATEGKGPMALPSVRTSRLVDRMPV